MAAIAPPCDYDTVRITRVSGSIYRQAIRHREIVLRRTKVARPWHYTVLVRVDTDAGLTGWGEAFGHYGVAATTLVVLETLVAPRCAEIELTVDADLPGRLARELHALGGCGPVAYARSGLDIALWDLRGKAEGVPVHALLGGGKTAALPAYASMMRYGDAEAVAAECAVALERRYAAVKVHEIDDEVLRSAAAAAARLGKPLRVDANCAWNLPQATAKARLLASLDAGWLEEPVWPPEDYRALGRLRQRTKLPLAAGENATSTADFVRLLDAAAVDYAQPSVTKIGGISAMRTIHEAAASRGVRVSPHSPYFGPGLIATLQFCAALAPEAQVEHLFYDMDEGPFGDAVKPSNGRFEVPNAPGLGVDPDPEVLARCRI